MILVISTEIQSSNMYQHVKWFFHNKVIKSFILFHPVALSGRPDLLPKTLQRSDAGSNAAENAVPTSLDKSGFVHASQPPPHSLDACRSLGEDLNNSSDKNQEQSNPKR